MFPKHLASDSNITSPFGEQTQTIAIKKINLTSKQEISWSAGPSGFVSEPIMVPSENFSKEDEGFLFILLWNGERRGSDLVILDAKDLKELAVYELPISIPHGLHGSWVN